MEQISKELLLKDLCARLPYGVYYKHFTWDDEREEECIIAAKIYSINSDGYVKNCYDDETVYIDNVHPYLFPLSSITIEQEQELLKLGVSYGEYALHDDIRGLGIMVDEAYIFFEFCYKHHIDFLGLIEMGLAIDATGLNIY